MSKFFLWQVQNLEFEWKKGRERKRGVMREIFLASLGELVLQIEWRGDGRMSVTTVFEIDPNLEYISGDLFLKIRTKSKNSNES